MTIGEKLKRERKKMGHDLDSVAQKTKIAKMFLIAIENDDLSSLPGGVYTRNFLRAYAKFLNLDEDIITAEYHEQYDVKPHFVVHQEQTKRDDGQFKRQRSRFFLALFLFALIIAGIIVVTLYFPFWKKEPVETTRKSTITANHTLSGPLPDQNKTTTAQKPLSNNGNLVEPNKNEQLSQIDSPKSERELPAEEVDAASSSVNSSESLAEGNTSDSGNVTESVGQIQGKSTAEALATSQLPFSSVGAMQAFIEEKGLQPSVFYGAAEQLDQVFIIEAVSEVDLEVYVDGQMATRRLLKPGQIRFYQYGNYNRVIIGDISKVNIQDGNQVFSGNGRQPRNVFVHDFEPGQFLIKLRESMNSEL